MCETIKKDLSQLLEMREVDLIEEYRIIDHDLWDSLSMVSIMSSITKHFQTTVSSDALEACQTVRDIYDLLPQAAMIPHG
jgi:acyl carrier protein